MRIRRFTKRTYFYGQNKTFQENTKKFDKELGKNQIKVEENHSREEIEESGVISGVTSRSSVEMQNG